MKIESISVSEIKPNSWNANELEIHKYRILVNNIKKYGMLQPILINLDYTIIDGFHRWKAAKEAGLENIDCVIIENDQEEAKIKTIAFNQLRGEYDTDKMASLINDILEHTSIDNIELETGLMKAEIEKLLNIKNIIEEDDFNVDNAIKDPKYKIQKGEIWQLGEHRLMCGDSTNKEDVEKLMNGQKADMVFTDPPYNVNYSGKTELLNLYYKGNRIQTDIIKDNFINFEEFSKFCEKWFNILMEYMSDYNSVYICGNYETLIKFHSFQKDFKISNILIWAKNNQVFGRMDYKCKHENILYGWKTHHKWYGDNSQTTVWEIDKPLKSDLHPTMKPIELCLKAINNSSLENQIVLDLFGGSGSTLIACEQVTRKCYMMEIDPIYCSVILERWENLTNKKAEKLENL